MKVRYFNLFLPKKVKYFNLFPPKKYGFKSNEITVTK